MAWICGICNNIDLAEGIQNNGNCMRCGAMMLPLNDKDN